MTPNYKIAISGAHSQGKTTLVNALKQLPEFKNFQTISGITRDLEKINVPINEVATETTQQFIMAKHYQYAHTNGQLLMDRCALDGLAYSMHFRSKIPSWMWNYFIQVFSTIIGKYNKIFYIEPTLPLIDDGVRSTDELFFKYTVKYFENIIEDFKVPVIRIKGTTEQRVNFILNNL
jgi:predicted ATPase